MELQLGTAPFDAVAASSRSERVAEESATMGCALLLEAEEEEEEEEVSRCAASCVRWYASVRGVASITGDEDEVLGPDDEHDGRDSRW